MTSPMTAAGALTTSSTRTTVRSGIILLHASAEGARATRSADLRGSRRKAQVE